MISHVINVIKEGEIDALVMPWVNMPVAYLLVVREVTATIEDGALGGESDPNDYDEIVTTKEAETIDAFSSWVIHTKMKTAHQGEGINMMTQAFHIEDGSLPQGLTVQNTYTKIQSSSKNIAVVVRNSTAYSQTLRKKAPVARAVAVTQMPEFPVKISSTKASEVDHGHQVPKLTMKQRQEKLLKELDLSSLESWPPELAAAAQSLLAEYHHIFSLEPGELGCTHSMTHMIKVTDDTPFKEQFRQIPPSLVAEVHTLLQEMLDSGAICNINAVVLVWKKDGALHVCIDFQCLNAHTKKDSYLLPRIQEALESSVSAGYFSCLDLKV